ncbi:MAG TPA: precorrin-6y C5,15-methyltransferase (decarboxylating) subunit CbiE [Acidimicrobiales bacterium]|nr:precorrin-6y C5,15-methyltransferase (decarboxylating) subunit CbiE [Acidimicrobiales bacterium]
MTRPESPPASIAIVGLIGGQWFGHDAEATLRAADVLLGHARQFALLDPTIPGERVELWGNLQVVLDRAVEVRDHGGRPCILADGDPGLHGIVGFAAAALGEEALAVHPAPSSIALAFARVGTGWDDAVIVSLRRRTPEEAAAEVLAHDKAAVLVSPANPPEALGRALVAAGADDRRVAVCARMGEPEERIVRTDAAGLAAGPFDPFSVVVVRAG